MNESGIPLDYAPPPKRGYRIRARYLVLGVLLALAAVAYVPVRNAWARAAERARFAALVRQCLNDAPPPTTIAYEDNPDRAAALAGTPGYTTLVHPAGGLCTGRQPSYWFEVRQTGNWLELWPDDPVLFLHVRRSASGQERLLLVHARRSWPK